MNLNALFGLLAAVSIVWFGVVSPAAHPSIFADHHALILVFGGTLAAALIAFSNQQLRDLAHFLLLGMFFPPKKLTAKTIEHLFILAKWPALSSLDHKDYHPFLLEAYTLALRDDLKAPELKLILHTRMQKFRERYSWDVKTLTALAKFPPAFGLLGATTGMIAMMTGLGGAAGQENIGPAMAVALVATFWGIAIANLVLLPLADRASRLNYEDQQLREMIAGGILLIQQEASPSLLFEYLIGFMTMKERSDVQVIQSILAARNRIPLKNGIQLASGDNP